MSNLDKARAAKALKAERRRKANLKAAAAWHRALRAEAQARYNLAQADATQQPKLRRTWLHAREVFYAQPLPTDDALRELRGE